MQVSLDSFISGVGRVSPVVPGTLIAKMEALALPHFFPVPAKVRAIWTTLTAETTEWGWCCHCGGVRPFVSQAVHLAKNLPMLSAPFLTPIPQSSIARNVGAQGLMHRFHKFCYRSMISLCIPKKVPRFRYEEKLEDERYHTSLSLSAASLVG
jgi:hypothetical protein